MHTPESIERRGSGLAAALMHLLLAGCAAAPADGAAVQDTASPGSAMAEPAIPGGRRLRCSGRPHMALALDRPFITSQDELEALTTCATSEHLDFGSETVVALSPGSSNSESIQVLAFEVDEHKTLVAKRAAKHACAGGHEREAAPARLYAVSAIGLERLRDEVERAPAVEHRCPQLP